MKISVIICTYNRSDLLKKTINSVLNQTTSPFEIIIVDNNSKDDTKKIVDEIISNNTDKNLIYHLECEQGATKARNAGGKIAQGNLLVFFDDDIKAPNNYFENLLNAFKSNNLDYVGGGIDLKFLSPKPEWLDERLSGILAFTNYRNDIVDYPCTGKKYPFSANIAIRKEVFDEVGGFVSNELKHKWAKPCNDDILFGMKVKKAGFRITYIPDITVEHLITSERLSISGFKRYFYFYGLADIIHGIIPNNLNSLIMIFFRSIYRIIVGFIKSKIISEPKEKHWQLFRIYYNSGLIMGIISLLIDRIKNS